MWPPPQSTNRSPNSPRSRKRHSAWSARATQLKRSGKRMDSIIERLRASKERTANEDKSAGHAAGRSWASDHAEYEELMGVAAWEYSVGADYFRRDVLEVIQDDGGPEDNQVDEFW